MFSVVWGCFFSLHFLLDYFRGQFEAEFFQQDLLVISRLGNAPGSDLRAGASWEHDVHGTDVGQLGKHSARFASQASFVTELTQRFPKHVGKEAHEDVSQHTLLFLMPDRANRQVALMNAKCSLSVPLILPPKSRLLSLSEALDFIVS